MRYKVLIGVALVLLCACGHTDDPFIGRWTVDKVNVEFDEEWATPEMVRQVGAMEKNNVVVITADSSLMLVNEGDTARYRCSLRGNQILCNGEPWGWFADGAIKTETSSPMGGVKVLYKKSNR